MAQVIVTPRAQRDVDEAISALKLPGDYEDSSDQVFVVAMHDGR